MKSVVAVVLALCVAFVASQSASTNPAGATYFFPSTNLPINTTVSGTLYNTTGNYYADFYRVWVPSYVAALDWTVNNTGSDANYVDVEINFVWSGEDDTFGYSCSGLNGDSYNSPCSDYDQSIDAYTGNSDSESYQAGNYFAPGRWQYATVSRYYSTSNFTTYTLSVKPTTVCTNTSIVTTYYDAGYTTGCAEISTISNVTSNGQTFTAQSVASGSSKIYQLNVPENVTRVYTWVAADQSSLYVLTSGNYAALDYYTSWDYTSSGYLNSTTGKYNFFLEHPKPTNNQPIYFAVSPSAATTFDIQFFWNQCDATHAGYGRLYTDVYAGVAYFTDEPDCQYTIANNNVNLMTSLATTTVTVAAYNSTTDYYNDYHATYATVYVPANTVGALNFTCNSTDANTFVAFSLNRMTTCDDYLFYLTCTGGSQTTSYYNSLLSHDLFPGGWWSVSACNGNSASVSVSLVASGSVSAAPSASPSSGSDESASSAVVPALLFTVLAAVLAF